MHGRNMSLVKNTSTCALSVFALYMGAFLSRDRKFDSVPVRNYPVIRNLRSRKVVQACRVQVDYAWTRIRVMVDDVGRLL